MAIPTNIKTLLSGDVVEWARIEFKETWDAEASLKSVCAFANDLDNWGGGYIVIGVEENEGQPVYPLKGVPVDKIDAYQKSILSKCKLIRPAYMPIVEVVDYENKKFIVLWCPGGDSRPYSSPKTMTKDNKERIHYIRKMSSTVEPSNDEEKDLFNLANRIPFDDRVNHQAEMSDLNITLIQNYLKEVKSSLYEKSKTGDFVEVCSDMNIISNLPEYTKPKNVGVMFFSMEPDKFFPYTQIDVVQFPDGLGGNNIIEQTFKGPIQQQLRDALQYIRNTIITEKVVKHPERAEADRFFNYPFAAIEEALSNAVYHRAYDEREPIEVRVENDRIEILSFPGPDRSVTIEGLKSYRVSNRRYRNRRIGDFLKELHLTEGRNTGFKKILDALEANGSPKPEFETDEAHSYFITRLFVHEGFNSVDKDVRPKEPKRSKKGAEKELKKGNERKQAIMDLLIANPTMTQKQLREQLNLTRKQIQTDMKELQEEGILMREGSNRKGHWVIINRN
ncbi:RNA-binding domain-containing protein [Frisingicoccus sp.]|uniref:RNA-binding domain-containing protein n=1 Tax=Frisingicoccus sp. TaxID=1918627 RepID=UPI003AB60769